MSDDETLSPEDQEKAVKILEGIVVDFSEYPLPKHLVVAVQKIEHILVEVYKSGKLTKRLWEESGPYILLLLEFRDNTN